MGNRIVQAVYDLKDNVTGKLQKIGEALGANRAESNKTATAVERDNKRASESYKQTADSLGFLHDNLGKIAAAAGVALAAMKGLQFGANAFKGAADVEQSLARVKAIAGATAEEFDKLSEQVTQSAIAADVSTTAAANAAAALAEKGQTANEIFRTLTPTLLLAKTASLEVGEAAGVVDDAIDLFGKSAADASLMVDQLVAASKGAKDGVGGMATAIRALAPDARATGMDFDQLVGLLGVFSQNGIDAGKSAKGLRSLFQDLQDPTSKFALSLAQLGDSSGDFGKAIETLRSSGKRGEDALLGLSGASRSLVQFLLQQAPGAVDAFTASLAKAGGTAAATAQTIDNTFKGALDSFGNALDRLGKSLMDTSLEPFRIELQKLAGQLTEFAASPDFERLRDALATIFENGTVAFDEFIQSLDWNAMVTGAQTAFASAGKSIDEFKTSLATVAESLNTIGATVGVVARSIAVVFDLAKVGISALVAQKASEFAMLAEAVDLVTGKTSTLTMALEAVRNAADDAVSNGIADLRDNSDKLVDNLSALTGVADEAATKVSRMGDSFKSVEEGARSTAAAATRTIGDFNAITGSAESMAATLGFLPELFNADATAAGAAAAAHKDHTEQILAARQAVEDARASLKALAESGEHNSVAFQQAANALQQAQGELDRLTGKADQAAASQRALEQAFKGLRITSQAELQQTAADAATNFGKIQQAFEGGKASIEDVRRAFEAYTKQQRAAVADSDQWVKQQLEGQLAVQASVLGLSDAFATAGAAGKEAGDKTAEAFDRAKDKINKAGDAADSFGERAKQSTDKLAESAKSAEAAYSGIAVLTREQEHALREMNAELFRTGDLSGISLERARQLLEGLGTLTGGQTQMLTARINELEDAARRAEETARRMSDEAASLQDQIDQMQGNESSIEDRRHQRKLDDLKAEAEAAGELNSAAYRNLVDLENKLHALKLKNLREQGKGAGGGGGGIGGTSNDDRKERNPPERTPKNTGDRSERTADMPGRPITFAPNIVLLTGDQKAREDLARWMLPEFERIAARSR